MATVTITREERGRMIAEQPNAIQRLDEGTYKVVSQSGNGMYDVLRSKYYAMRWVCNCPDWVYRQVKCKHIWAVEFSLRLRNKVKESIVLQPIKINTCLHCKSENIKKDGLRHNKSGVIQVFACKACGRFFTVNLGFEKMKHNPQGITTAMQLYFSGESLRNTARSLRLIGIQVSCQTVWNWIEKYTALMEKYLAKIQPQVGDTWRADEIFLKVHGNMKYLYALMDDETRFWIAQEVADTKYHADIHAMFHDGRHVAGKAPQKIITDGAMNFGAAINDEFWREKKQLAIKHERDIRFGGEIHNNKMERMNGEIRDREKVMRSLKKPDTPILTGMQIFHNYVRPHMALDGKTPSQAAGIDVQGENRWLTLIQNASQPTHFDTKKEPTKT